MKKIQYAFLCLLVAGCAIAPPALAAQSSLAGTGSWKDKVLYLGGSFGLGTVSGPDGNALGGNLSPLRIDWQITKFLALGSGVDFYFAPKTVFTAPKQTDPDSGIFETYGGMETHIVFPLLLQLSYRPGIFSLEIGGGLYAAPIAMNTTVERTNDNGYTVSEGYGKKLFRAERDNPLGVVASAAFGVNVGRGILFLDLSYLRDFAETTVTFNGEKTGRHLWSIFSVNVGYKYGFFNIR